MSAKTEYGIQCNGRKQSRGRWAITHDGKVMVGNLRFKQARRRARGLNRGEMDITGKTIKVKDRK